MATTIDSPVLNVSLFALEFIDFCFVPRTGGVEIDPFAGISPVRASSLR